MKVQPHTAKFKNTIGRVVAHEVVSGDFILIDIGPNRNPQTGVYSEVVEVINTGDHITIITKDGDRVCRRGDSVAYLRRSRS